MPHQPAMPDRTVPEDTVHDATVRMRPDGDDGRPTPDQGRPAPIEDHEDTRPVTRDWLLGAPDTGGHAASRARARV